jgi:AraC-like DNA-binding protein
MEAAENDAMHSIVLISFIWAAMPPVNQNTRNSFIAIEETRQEPTEFFPQAGPPRGVLHANEVRGGNFFHQRIAPPSELAPWVQHYWYVQWDLRHAQPSEGETMPHPNCYLVFEHDLERPPDDVCVFNRAEVSGVNTGKFSRVMKGYGRVFGFKFKPGGLRPFLQASVSTLTDRTVPAAQVFGQSILRVAVQLRGLATPEAMASATSAYFRAHLPATDPHIEVCSGLVETIFDDRSILTVETLARRSGCSVRTLQRLFKVYVGASPKWVIRRYRLHEMLERFHSRDEFDGAQLALDLGYADQAHLINDFRKLTGYTPKEYVRNVLTKGGT